MPRRQLLFATYHTKEYGEGFAYAVDLAKTLDKDLRVLLVSEKGLSDAFNDIMTAVTFAEEYGKDTSSDVLEGGYEKLDARSDDRLAPLSGMCHMAGVSLEIFTTGRKLVSAINGFIKKDPQVDMVLLGPTVTDTRSVSARELKRLVTGVSRPVVTMARHAMGNGGG